MKKYIIITYGCGGHQEQMRRLLNELEKSTVKDIRLIIFTDSIKPLDTSFLIEKTFIFPEARDKYSLIKSILLLPKMIFLQLFTCLKVVWSYKVSGVISTGPGVSILPSLFFKLMGCRLICFESWSRFSTPSLTAVILSRFSDLFFVQNLSITKKIKNSIYKGRL